MVLHRIVTHFSFIIELRVTFVTNRRKGASIAETMGVSRGTPAGLITPDAARGKIVYTAINKAISA